MKREREKNTWARDACLEPQLLLPLLMPMLPVLLLVVVVAVTVVVVDGGDESDDSLLLLVSSEGMGTNESSTY